ncbi:MAG: hypothetical protein KC983_06430 [Phycisphaerales bacterium]|nr:hypothetical protein [Phycisphaerales bacterium]
MHEMPLQPALAAPRIRRSAPADGHAIVTYLRTLDFARDAVILKTSRHGTVWRVPGGAVHDGDLVVKCERVRATDDRVKSQLGQTRLHRHWRGARWLTENGFDTPACLVLFTGKRDAELVETLIMAWRDGASLLDHLRDDALPIRSQHKRATDLGALCRTMVDRGRFNRDNKPSNVLMSSEGSFTILDCVAIRRCRAGHAGALARMLASLYIEPSGTGCAPRRTLCWRAIRAAAGCEDARAMWRRCAMIVADHGSSAPLDAPFG